MERASVVVCGATGYEADAAVVARSLTLVQVAAPAPDGLTLLRDASGWSLTDATRGAPVRADFLQGDMGRRIREAPQCEGRLTRALGLKRHPAPLVLDATAGLGRESMLAAALGCTVIACERSPMVALLLRDGLDRAADGGLEGISSRITLHEGDARELLTASEAQPDVVLVDPMFPEQGKSAKARREMQLLQQLLGPDDDAEALLHDAIAVARRRVVVKRPSHAPPVGSRTPSHTVEGRAARYDIYLTGQPAERSR